MNFEFSDENIRTRESFTKLGFDCELVIGWVNYYDIAIAFRNLLDDRRQKQRKPS